jgi:hypothetical protein
VRIRTRLIPVAVAAVVSAGLYAIHLTSPPAKHTVHAPYSTAEALEFMLFSTGRVVADHPDLAKQSPLGTASDAEARTAIESVTRCVDHLDATAGPALTAAFNAADPQRLDSALQRFDAAARRWVSAPYPQDAPCPEPPPPPKYGGEYTDPGGKGWWRMNGEGYLNYVFYGEDFYLVGVTVGGALVISVAGLVALVAAVWATFFWVPVIPSYEFENAPTDFDHQTALAKLARALRS